MSAATFLLYTVSCLFTGGLGVLFILFGAGTLSFDKAKSFLSSAGGIAVLFLSGACLIILLGYFLLLIYRSRLATARFSQEGEQGKIEISPYAIQEFISGILQEELGITRFRVRLRHKEDGVAIYVHIALTPQERVAEIGSRIQETLTSRVMERTGVEVKEVSVLVGKIRPLEQKPQEKDEEDEEGDDSENEL